jgi:hypothetical protein
MKLLFTSFATLFCFGLFAQVSPLPTMNQFHSGHTCTLAELGNVVVAGGWDGTQVSGYSEMLDVNASEWIVIAEMNDARTNHTAHSLFDGRVMVIGGWDGNLTNLASTEIYFPVIDEWEAGPSLAIGRSNHRSIVLDDGRILIAGGYDGSADLSVCEIYHPAFGTLESVASMNVARSSFSMVTMADGRVLVSGGFNPMEGFQLLSCEIYDPIENTWTMTGNMDFMRDNHAGFLLDNGQVLVTGGRTYNPDLNLFEGIAFAELFNPTIELWETLSMPFGVSYHSMFDITGAGVSTLGGTNQTGDGVTTTYSAAMWYDPDFQGFSPAPEEWEDENRYRYAACALGDGTVVVTGGDEAEVGTAIRLGLFDAIEEPNAFEIQIFPNPAVDKVLVVAGQETPQWRLMNMSGQTIKTGKSTLVELQEIVNGTYLIEVKTSKGSMVKTLQIRQ